MRSAQFSKVFAVDTAQVRVTRTQPPWLIIGAAGRVPTTGWFDGQLIRHIHVAPPADGVQAFDFYAQMPAPDVAVLQVVTPISAHAELPDVDIVNYWGKGQALKGVRIHAVSNAKTVDVVPREMALDLAAKMSPQAVVSYVGDGTAAPSFAEDIRPLFRDQDVIVMQAIAGFNLHISCHALARIGDKSAPMPFLIVNPSGPKDAAGRPATFTGVVTNKDLLAVAPGAAESAQVMQLDFVWSLRNACPEPGDPLADRSPRHCQN